jgi:hypothetical protein
MYARRRMLFFMRKARSRDNVEDKWEIRVEKLARLRNGRPVRARTADLYRVKVAL